MSERWMRNPETNYVHLMRPSFGADMKARCGFKADREWMEPVKTPAALFLGKAHDKVCARCEASVLMERLVTRRNGQVVGHGTG